MTALHFMPAIAAGRTPRAGYFFSPAAVATSPQRLSSRWRRLGRRCDEFLRIAATLQLDITTQPYAFSDADAALRDLAADRITGAAVLVMPS